MPKRKTYSTRGRGPARKRRRTVAKRRKNRATVQRGPAFSNSQIVKLKYVERISMNPAIGVFSIYNFRANSLYDPNLSGTGHQPLGYDQWSAFYDHYNVIGAKIKCTFMSSGATAATDHALVGILLDDDVSSFSVSTSELMEQGKATTKFMSVSSAAGRAIVHKGFSAKRFFHLANVSDNVDRIGSSVDGSPSEEAYFRLFVGPKNTSLDVSNVDVLVEITYIAMFTEPKNLAQS